MQKKLLLTLLFTVSSAAIGATQCTTSGRINNQPLYYYTSYLGNYSINLEPTVTAIANGTAGPGYPYYASTWRSACPKHIPGSRGTCFEYTVYPNANNFNPDLMPALRNVTGGYANRGSVRIITDQAHKFYVYTTDHYRSFCGPYAIK